MKPITRRFTLQVVDIRQLDSARQPSAVTVNFELALLHWQVWRLTQAELLRGERDAYEQQIVPSPASPARTGGRRKPATGYHPVRWQEGRADRAARTGQDRLHVTEYLEVLPPLDTLQVRLYESFQLARMRLLGNRVGE